MARKPKAPKKVATLKHQSKRKNIPTAELQSVAQRIEEMEPVEPVHYPRTNPLAEGETRPRDEDLDPQIVWNGVTIKLSPEQIGRLKDGQSIDLGEAQLTWRGKDTQDWSDLVVTAPPLYIQEKVHPKAIIDDLTRQTKERQDANEDVADLFGDFNGIDQEAVTEFYAHDQNWSNRMILGDSLQVMASLAERESLRGKVQCIYFDPPYGIKFNSNWQVSTRNNKVKDGKQDQITREPEQVKAFRDTWKDGIHSYLSYLRDRLTAMHDLLSDSGSIFVQIGDENVHRVRAVMDEVFGEENFVSIITFVKTSSQTDNLLAGISDYILMYARNKKTLKYRQQYRDKIPGGEGSSSYKRFEDAYGSRSTLTKTQISGEAHISENGKIFAPDNLTSQSPGTRYDVAHKGQIFYPTGYWKTEEQAMPRLQKASRVTRSGKTLRYVRYLNDFPVYPYANNWDDTSGGVGSDKTYVVQTSTKVIQRCILMATDPGDLVLDPTCGSGTSATVAEQWGRRWITIDTSRVALALARTRIMSARYPYYYLADSPEGRDQEAIVTSKIQPDTPTHGDIRQGFVYNRAPHITLKSIANNAEIDVIWETYEEKLAPLRSAMTKKLPNGWLKAYRAKQKYDVDVPDDIQEWEVPRDLPEGWSKDLHEQFWELRIARQKEIDTSIAQKADVEMLYDRPYEDKSRVRVAGPFTVESLSPHRVISGDEAELIDEIEAEEGTRKRKDAPLQDFTQMVLENLLSAGVHQAAKDDRISFNSLTGWPGHYVAAEGHFTEGKTEKRAAIFIGPEFGTVSRADLTAAAREALDARFEVLIACGFNFEAHTSELDKLGPLPILRAKMNPDLHMSDELKNTGAGNLFIVFGEPDIEWKFDDNGDVVVEVLGIDVFDPKTGEVRASGKNDIATWFIDTDYNEESFFVRHAYFLGANDPYKQLKTTLKAEIDREAWDTLYRDVSRPFPRPESGRFAVKVINHFGDEVMKVFGV